MSRYLSDGNSFYAKEFKEADYWARLNEPPTSLPTIHVNPELGENIEEYTKLMRDIFGH